jgi:hypothetical protein
MIKIKPANGNIENYAADNNFNFTSSPGPPDLAVGTSSSPEREGGM